MTYNFSLLKNAGVYVLTNSFNALIPFILIPVYTRYLTPMDYGIIAMVQIIVGIISPFIGLNLHGVISVKYYDKKIDFPKYISNCYYLLIVTSFFMTFFIIVFHQTIFLYTYLDIEWFWAIILICHGQFVINIFLAILRVSNKTKIYIVFQISQSILNLCLSTYMVVVLNYNWHGYIIAQILLSVIFMIVSIIFLKKMGLLVLSYKYEYIKNALNFGVPLIPHTLSSFFIVMLDRVLLTNLVGVETAGLYAVGAQIGRAINLLVTSLNQAYAPWLYEKLGQATNKIKSRIVKFTYVYFILILIISILFSYSMPFLLKFLLGNNFYEAEKYIMGIAVAGAFNGMYCAVVNYIFYAEKTPILAYVTAFMAAIHTLITYYAIVWFGGIGATYTAIFTSFTTFLIVWIISAKYYPMPWLIKIKNKKTIKNTH